MSNGFISFSDGVSIASFVAMLSAIAYLQMNLPPEALGTLRRSVSVYLGVVIVLVLIFGGLTRMGIIDDEQGTQSTTADE